MAQIELLERDVKRLSNMNDVLLNQIAAIDLQQNGQEVRVAVTEEPVVMESPVSPGWAARACGRSWAVSSSRWDSSRCWILWTIVSDRSMRCRAAWASPC